MSTLAELFTADDRDRIARLQWYAQGVVEGLNIGIHRSPHKGSSIEFKEHRAYVRGDEIRLIDWKLFGKTDRLFIKQFEDETNLRATLVLDRSRSMMFQGQTSALNKYHYAVGLTACLGQLFVSQQDAVGLATFDTQIRDYLPPASTPSHLQQLNTLAIHSECQGETAISEVLRQLAPQVRRRGVVILISDCFDDTSNLLHSLSLLQQLGNEVIVFQIWDPDELSFPFRRRSQFQSLEPSGGTRMLEPRQVRAAYLKNLREFQQQMEEGCARQRISLVTCETSVPQSRLLSQFLAQGRR